jgi:bacteriocin biosynthesis cyclodehydratase domain-containing protein
MLPDRIQFNESLTVATLGATTLQFRSGESHVVSVAGNAVPQLIPALLGELTRPRLWPDVVAKLERIATPEVITQCAQALFDKGVLVAAPEQSGDVSERERAIYQFFAHPPHVPNELLGKVRSCRLGTLCEGALQEVLVEKLRAHGFVQFTDLNRDLSRRRADVEGLDLLIVVIPHMEASTLDAVNQLCLQTRTAWLPVDLFSGPFCALGPLITPGAGGCYECFRSRIRSNLLSMSDAYDDFITFQRSTSTPVSHYGMLPAGTDIAFGIVCLEALKLVTQVQVPACIGHNVIVDLVRLDLQKHRVLQVPRCPVCSNSDSAPQGHWTV